MLYRSILQTSMNQTCGKCVPCRDGLVEVDRLLGSVLKGDAAPNMAERLREMCTMIADTADCAVGVVAANTALDSLREFQDEYESHIQHRCCVEHVVQTVPCITLCPAHVDVPVYVALAGKGDYAGAVAKIRERNPFPTTCAMVCEHPSERKCRRAIVDAPINIRDLKKYAVDQTGSGTVPALAANVPTGKRVAVVGGGPSGMTCAWFLALMGHNVEIFDEHEKPGGMLRYGTPEYRLPKARLDVDISAILGAGDITLRCNTKIGRDILFAALWIFLSIQKIAVYLRTSQQPPLTSTPLPHSKIRIPSN